MTISPEVKLAVDEIHRERGLIASMDKAYQLQAAQIADLGAQISALKVGAPLSDDDKKALLDAVNETGETNAVLPAAVVANVDPAAAATPIVPPAPLPDDPAAPRPDPLPGTGLAGTVPPMPNATFDPSAGAPGAGVITTAGGFVVSGGGDVQRAPADPNAHPMSEAGVEANPPATPEAAPIAPNASPVS